MKRLLTICCVWLALIATTGCSADHLPDTTDGVTHDGLTPVSFCLQQESMVLVDSTGIATKAAAGEETEIAINNLTVLQFDWDGETDDGGTAQCVTARYFRSPEPENGTNNVYSIGLRAKETDKQYVVFIANAGPVFQNYEKKTLADFRKETMTPDQRAMNENNVMMIAAVATALKTTDGGTGSDTEIDVVLQRLVARIRFTWENSLTVTGAKFFPTELKIGNVPKVLKYADGLAVDGSEVADIDYPTKEADNFKDYTAIVDLIENGYTWYIPINRHALPGRGTSEREKDGSNAPNSYCTYVELSGRYTTPSMSDQLVTYRFYIGANQTNDYNVLHNHDYAVHAAIVGLNSFDKRVTKRVFEYVEPANSFVISPEAGNELSFNPYEAPGADVAGSGVVYKKRMVEDRFSKIAGVKVLWQTADNLLEEVSLDQGMINVKPNTSGIAGNALIAAYDESEPANILWSWHIWVTPYEKVLYGGDTGGRLHEYAGHIWMDRNLGALNANKGDDGAFGLYYQWGRKDPFYRGGIATGGTAVTVEDKGSALNIDQSVAAPTVFFRNQAGKNTWHGGEPLTGLWQPSGSKTLFDPCPAGWRVPQKAAWSTFVWGRNFSWDTANPTGAVLEVGGGLSAWYPQSGRLDNSTMVYNASYAFLWSSSFDAAKGLPVIFQFNKSSAATTTVAGSWGGVVRCVKE